MVIKRISNKGANVAYSLDDPLKIDIDKFFKELENNECENKQQVLGIDSAGRPARLFTIKHNSSTINYNLDKNHISIQTNEINKKEMTFVEDILFNKMEIIKEDFEFVEINFGNVILTEKNAINEIKKIENNEFMSKMNSLFSKDFRNVSLRLVYSPDGFDEKHSLAKIKNYHEIYISSYVQRPEYYHIQMVIRGTFDYVKNEIEEIENKIETIINYIEG